MEHCNILEGRNGSTELREFGRKGGMLDLKFGEGSLSFNDVTCKKL